MTQGAAPAQAAPTRPAPEHPSPEHPSPGTDGGHDIDEAGIERLVRRFYTAARDDALLGPVFAARVTDWEAHVATLCDFWSAILLGTRRYDGRPLAAHARLPVAPAHFERWLSLFGAAARECCSPETAALVIERAGRIAQSFSDGIAASRGTMPVRP